MQEAALAGDKADMALPIDQIAALELREVLAEIDRAAQLGLHVAVARTRDARRLQRELHQRRAIETERRAPAPKIGNAEQAARRRYIVRLAVPDRNQMLQRNMGALVGDRELALFPRDRKPASERKRNP